MRRHLTVQKPEDAAAIALESLVVATLAEKPVLSLEEEVVVLSEADTDQAEITAGLQEAARVEDISDNLLVMADDVDQIPELTPQQAALIDTAAEMAVAGTDGQPDDVIPAMEPNIGQAVATEGFRETARNIWENIRKFIMNLWEKVRSFFNSLFSTMPRQLARIKALRELIAEKKKAGADKTKSETGKTLLLVGSQPISYPGHMVTNAKDLVKGITGLKGLADYAFGDYAKNVAKQGDVIATELKSFDPRKAAEALSNTRKKLTSINFNYVPPAPTTGYLGSFSLRAQRVDPKKSADLSDAQVLNALRHTGVFIETTVARGVSGTSSIEHRTFDVMTIAEMESVLGALEAVIKSIVAFEGGGNWKAMETTRQSLIAAGNSAQTAAAKMDNGHQPSKSEEAFATDVMKSLMNFNTTYVGWSSRLTGECIKRLLSTCRVSLIMVDKSLATY